MAAMEKVFKCLTCQKEIRLERKPDNKGWNKYNLDDSEHIDEKNPSNKKNNYPSQTQEKLEQLTTEIAELRSEVRDLVAAVQFLRMELKQKK